MDRGLPAAKPHPSRAFALATEAPAEFALNRDLDRKKWILLGCVACLYLPLIFAGPDSDPDSMRELRSGATLLRQHHYVLSRPPGYFPYELLCGILYALGGGVANNLATMAMSLVLLDSFLRICSHFEVPYRYLLAATMAMQPVYWCASTSTIDFIWALGCFLLGFRLLLNGRDLCAASMLGLAVGIRLSSILLVGPLLIWEIVDRPRDVKLWRAAALATALGAILYLPEFISSGNSLRFLTYYIGAWTLTDRLGRFLYKNVYFWGLPATLLVVIGAPTLVRALVGCDRRFHRIVALSISIMLAFEALFLKIPVQRAYLLPMLPFALILFGIALREHQRMLLALMLAVVSYNLANLNLARPDVPDRATHARLGLFIEPGYLLSDIANRLALARDPISSPLNQ